MLSSEEEACEEHYKVNTTRSPTGRYIVRLPFKNNRNQLGTSQMSALRRFQSLERRFEQDTTVKKNYIAFLHEYQNLGHMSVLNNALKASTGFYLPHHAVIKQESLTSKIRVVFDGSAKTSTGILLNDV